MAKKAYVWDGTAWQEITSDSSIPGATTSNTGIVQLVDSVSSTSTVNAAVPNSVKTAYDAAVAAQATADGKVPTTRTLTGTAPITVGGVSGTGQALSANLTVAATAATTSAAGVVQLSDSVSTTSSVLAATPTAVKSAYDLANAAIPKSTVTTAGDVIYGTASSTLTRLGIGTAGQVLTVNSGATAPSWSSPNLSLTLNPQSLTTYTLAAGDLNKLVQLSNTSAITLTIPANILAVGDQIHILQTNTGQVTVAAGANVASVNSPLGLKLRTQWSSATLIKLVTATNADSWLLIGDTTA